VIVWRLRRFWRSAVSFIQQIGVAGCSHEEDVQHLFISCSTFGTLWQLVRSWIGFDGVDSQVITNHFERFIYYTNGLKSHRSFLQLILLLCVWIVWNERNSKLFKQKKNIMFQLLEKVKLYSLWLLKGKKSVLLLGLICGGRARLRVWASADLYLSSCDDFVNSLRSLDTPCGEEIVCLLICIFLLVKKNMLAD